MKTVDYFSRLRKFCYFFAFILLIIIGAPNGLAANFYQGISPGSLYWTGGIVPYVFDTNVTAAEQIIYLDGMREWELAANVHFIPHTTESNYVILRFGYTQGVDTFVASVPPVLTVDTLSRSQVAHETGHLLGFQHEHVRTNRDNYITVNFDNLEGSASSTNNSGEGNNVAALYAIDTNSTAYGAYDFESVMHYGRTLFSLDPDTLDVLVPNPPYFAKYYYRIGDYALSPLDRAGAAHLYGPPATPLTSVVTNTADVGFGSLRAAIYYANDHPGTTITFNIPATDPGYASGVYTIYTTGELPPLVADGTVIDATSQPGYSGHPLIALDGSGLSPELTFPGALFVCGFRVFAANDTIKGFAINHYPYLGISIEYACAVGNHIEGCYLGLAPDGVTGASNNYQGIMIDTGASGNVVGGTNASQRNVISGNGQYGILIIGTNDQRGATLIGTNTASNVVLGNYIGLNAAGNASVANPLSGIGIWGGSSSNLIGGSSSGAGNVISGNLSYGVYTGYYDTIGNVFQGNYVGTDASGTFALINGDGGIGLFAGANHSLIGGTTLGARNVISGNGNAGIWLDSGGTNTVQGNFIGLNATGDTAIPNTTAGIYVVDGTTSNLIGGEVAGARNIISGNTSYGIYVSNPGTSLLQVQGNYLGTDPSGTTAIPNGYSGIGIWDGAANIQVGGTTFGAGNIISGNAHGMTIGGLGVTGVQIFGNYIGTAPDGITAVPNTGLGIYIEDGPTNNQIGGTLSGAGNLISGNDADGIQFFGTNVTGNLVQGNLIGTTKTGLNPLGNRQSGISLLYGPQDNTIGGNTAAARNIIAGNVNAGIYLTYATNNFIQGNFLGIGADAATPLGNGNQGIVLLPGAATNIIGLDLAGAGAGNLIANNAFEGILAYDPTPGDDTISGNTIRGNSLCNNAGLGINLLGGVENSQGVTSNHLGAMAGPNNLQNYPVITTATAGSATTISGTLNSTPNHHFFIDLYRNPAADPSGFGEGQAYLGHTTLTTDADGNATFNFATPGNHTGQYLTATATDAATGDTSEFSADLLAVAAPNPPQITGPYTWNPATGFTFNLSLQLNQACTIQAATNLATPVTWTNLATFTATNAHPSFTDPAAASNFPTRFYRLLSP